MRASFVRDGQDFSSVLGRVKGTLYVGRTSAGGKGTAIDLDNDGKDDVIFSQTCAFILQLILFCVQVHTNDPRKPCHACH